jgi:hypothetical protein
MRPAAPLPRLTATLSGLAAATALAQAPASRPAAPAPDGREQAIERIQHEDQGARIDELRVGGETRQITVQPKGEAPAYEVSPESNNRNPAGTDGHSEGQPRWNLFRY